MMLLLIGIALLLIAGAVVVLFAIVGELAPRVPAPTPIVEPYEEIVVGQTPQIWPESLPDSRRCVLLVLSTMCNVCADIADQLVGNRINAEWPELGLVIATTAPKPAMAFVAKHGLAQFRYYVDEGGQWLETQLSVRHSPVALVVANGRLLAAYRFSDLATLRPQITNDLQAA